jgi:hypothetical protein
LPRTGEKEADTVDFEEPHTTEERSTIREGTSAGTERNFTANSPVTFRDKKSPLEYQPDSNTRFAY